MGFRLGDTMLSCGLVLAPMAGVTDASFRIICRELGAEYTVSEMLSAKALCYEQLCRKTDETATKTASLAKITVEEMPCAVQLFGSEPEYMAEAAALLTSGEYRGGDDGRMRPAAIDINMGCPVHKVVSNGEGSALMKTPALAAKIVEAVKRATDLPVTVKMRAGWDAGAKNAPELARLVEAAGADAVCVHARTREQMYAPGTDPEIIYKVKQAVKIPVIGNGDIFSADDAIRMINDTGADGVAVARGALGNPWIFSEIRARLEGREFAPPTPEERLSLALRHGEDMIRRKGEHIGLAEARPHLSRYTQGLRGSASARGRIMVAPSLDEIKKIFDELLEINK